MSITIGETGGRAIIARIAIVLVVASTSACTGILDQYQNSISSHKIPVEVVTVTTKWPKVAYCLKTPGGMCSGNSSETFSSTEFIAAWSVGKRSEHSSTVIAATALGDPTTTSLQDIMDYASGRSVQGQEATPLSRTGARAFAKNLFDATNTGGWTQLVADLKVERSTVAAANPADPRVQSLTRAINFASIVGTYLSAYFENGHFVTITIDPSHVEASAESELQSKLGFSSNAAKQTVSDIEKQLTGETVGSDGKYHLLTAKGDGGFVTRGGDKYSVPTISANFTPGAGRPLSASKVDFPQIGSDVIRVYIEAVGDYWSRLPGTPQATGVKAKLLASFAADAPNAPLTETQFMTVNDWSSRAETATAGATGQLIRGIGWISLNNEALAKIIETAAGVAVRKGAEKVVWCVEACGNATGMAEFVQSDQVAVSKIRISVVE